MVLCTKKIIHFNLSSNLVSTVRFVIYSLLTIYIFDTQLVDIFLRSIDLRHIQQTIPKMECFNCRFVNHISRNCGAPQHFTRCFVCDTVCTPRYSHKPCPNDPWYHKHWPLNSVSAAFRRRFWSMEILIVLFPQFQYLFPTKIRSSLNKENGWCVQCSV